MPFRGVQHSKCPKFAKIRGANPKLCPFTGLSCPFLVIPHACPYFLEYALTAPNVLNFFLSYFEKTHHLRFLHFSMLSAIIIVKTPSLHSGGSTQSSFISFSPLYAFPLFKNTVRHPMAQPVSNVYQIFAIYECLAHIWENNTFRGAKCPIRYSITKILGNRKPSLFTRLDDCIELCQIARNSRTQKDIHLVKCSQS